MLGKVNMNLDIVRTKWFLYSKGMLFNNEQELKAAREAFEYAWVDGYLEGHKLGTVESIANSAIDKAMSYDR